MIGSVPNIWVSRPSLGRRDARGFYRFFAFEAILGLIALNAPVWFSDPFAPRQLAAWALLASLVHPVHLLKHQMHVEATMKTTVIYYSKFGHTRQLAEAMESSRE